MMQLLSVSILLLVAPEQEVDTATELDIRGRWKVAEIHDGGGIWPKPPRHEIVIGDDRLEVRSQGKIEESYKLTKISKGKLDFQTSDGTYEAIYKRTGDRLLICWDELRRERPRDFTTKERSNRRLVILERKKPE